MPARRRCTVRATERSTGSRSATRCGSRPLSSLRSFQGLQRAERPGVLARTRDHEHRPASLDGLRGRPRLRHDQRADQGDQGGRGRPADTGSVTAACKTCNTSATSPRRSCGHSSIRSRGPTRSTCGVRSCRSRRSWPRWATWPPRRRIDHARRPPVADRLRPGRFTAPGTARPDPADQPARRHRRDLPPVLACCASRAGSTLSDLA